MLGVRRLPLRTGNERAGTDKALVALSVGGPNSYVSFNVNNRPLCGPCVASL